MSGPLLSEVCAILDAHVGRELTPERAVEIAGEFLDLTLGHPLDLSAIPAVQVGSYTMAAERLADVLPEVSALYEAHWNETEDYRHGLPFNPDYEWALQSEAAGKYLLLTLRHEGKLVGNYGLVFSRSHHTQTLLAHEDTMFIAPEHRRGRNFLRFAQFGEAAARCYGAVELRLNTKLTNKVGDMLPRMGYTHVANQYVKLFRDDHVR